MEMNTRIQVEYAISEEISGIDIVGAQLQLAYGQKLADIPVDTKKSLLLRQEFPRNQPVQLAVSIYLPV